MARPDIIRGTYFVLALGDGGTPTEVFTAMCGITTRQFQSQTNTNDTFNRDCADAEDIPIRQLIATGRQWSISGNGQLNRANIADILAEDGQTSNWRFYWTEPAGDEVYQGYYEGPAKLVNITIDGNDEEFANISIQLESDGLWTFTPNNGS